MLRILLTLTIAASALMIAPTPSDACHNGVRVKVDPSVRAISQAERDNRHGKHAEAIRGIMRAWPNLRSDNLKQRARRVLAAATIHTEGKLQRDKAARPAQNTSQRSDNLHWAIQHLEAQLKTDRDNPALKVLLAEGLSQIPDRRAQALEILDDLDEAGLIVDARGYAALARLKREEGDLTGSAKAIKTCQQMAHDAALCTGFLAEGTKG